MKLKELENALQEVTVLTNPKLKYEQYTTPPHIASNILHIIHTRYNDIAGKCVADLGAGCGILSVGAVLLDARYCLAIEIDQEALDVCQENCHEFEVNGVVDLLQMDIQNAANIFTKQFETVVMNPPFGTKTKGVDMIFLKAALNISKGAVYSLHKSSTREHIKRKASQWNIDMQVLYQLRYNLDQSYKFHNKRTKDIEVDFIRFCHTSPNVCK